jgi:hypothetical protein
MRLTVHGGHPPASPCPPPPRMPRHWLMKSEPDEARSTTCRAPGQTLPWTGVRNYQARNFMRDAMQPGRRRALLPLVLPEPGIAGLASIAGGLPRPDAVRPRQPLPRPQVHARAPRWLQIDVRWCARRGCCRWPRCAPPRAGDDARAAARQPAVDHAGHDDEWRAVRAGALDQTPAVTRRFALSDLGWLLVAELLALGASPASWPGCWASAAAC